MKGRGLSSHLLYFWFAQNAPFSYHTCTGGGGNIPNLGKGVVERKKKTTWSPMPAVVEVQSSRSNTGQLN